MSGRIARPGWQLFTQAGADPVVHPGVVDLYRAIFEAAAAAVRRRRFAVAVEVTLVVAYFALRTIGVADWALDAWLAIVAIVTLVSPTSGLVVLAAIAPFNEGITVARVGSKTILAVAIAVGAALHWALKADSRTRPTVPAILAGGLLIGSGLGLVVSWQRWGADFVETAGAIWLQGVATMLIVFIATTLVARRGELRPLIAALVATTAAAIISLGDFGLGETALRGSPLGWLVAGPYYPLRLTGVIQSPTATAALVMLAATVLLVAAFLAHDLRLRIAAAVLAVPLVAAAYLTYNRVVFLDLYVVAVVIGWRIRRWLGIALLVGGLVVGALLLPSYLALRGAAVGSSGQPPPGQILITSDIQRLTAWATAGRMFLDQPLIGQGYRAYRQLSVEFGDPTLNAPHNEWLRFFAEGGVVVGLLGAGWALLTSVRLVRRPGWLESGIFASFASFCLAASVNNPFLFNQVTIPALILAGTGIGLAYQAKVLDVSVPDSPPSLESSSQ